MTAPVASESALREHLERWLRASRTRSHAILVRAQPIWSGAPTIKVGESTVRIVEGVSGLAAFDAIRSTSPADFVAVLTDLSETQLGTAVLLQTDGQRVTDLDEWNAVPSLFGVREYTVPRPVRDLGPWVPKVLSAWRRDRGYPLAPGGSLTAPHVIRSLIASLLGLDRPDDLDFSTALTPLDDPGVRARLRELDPAARASLITAAATEVDQHFGMALTSASQPGAVSVIAIGLAAAELWPTDGLGPDAATAAARVRAERYLGPSPTSNAATRFGAAARVITQRLLVSGDAHARDLLDQAEAVLGDVGWPEGAVQSNFLPTGLRTRISQLAAAFESAAASPSLVTAQAVDLSLAAIEAHAARSLFERSLPTATMAARLVRWLQTPVTRAIGLDQSISDYWRDGGWAERALGDLWDGDTDRELGAAYRSLAHAVQSRRRLEDASAAAHLTGARQAAATVIPVEDLLARLVVPLTASSRVLLVVLDGMSAPTAVELAPELATLGWTEVVPEATRRREVSLAALPTVTEYSRTSLFAGELLAGNQQLEKARFAAVAAGVVFHKDDLRSDAGHALPPAVSDAIADPKRKLVAAVLNTIDDALASADVDALRWSTRSIANLESLLGAAHDAGRVVILTSDHGHVVERASELRNIPGSSARWRTPASGDPATDELLVSGPRVLAPGGQAILAVSDGLRYASKRAGYHGGASLSELVIPIVVIKPRGADDPVDWVEAPPQEPTWWNEPSREVAPLVTPLPAAKRAPKSTMTAPLSSPTLFDPDPVVEAADAPAAAIAERLIASSTYVARRGIAGRHPVEDAVTLAIITSLVAGGGRAHHDTLASAAGVAAHTFSGLLAALRRVLNVDGYPVIDLDPDRVTVILDLQLLRDQFELGRA